MAVDSINNSDNYKQLLLDPKGPRSGKTAEGRKVEELTQKKREIEDVGLICYIAGLFLIGCSMMSVFPPLAPLGITCAIAGSALCLLGLWMISFPEHFVYDETVFEKQPKINGKALGYCDIS